MSEMKIKLVGNEQEVQANKNIQWHDHTKLLNMKDKDGLTPEIYISQSNRAGGKTYPFSRMLLKMKMDNSLRQIGLYCKAKQDLGSVASGIFGASLKDTYPMWSISEKVARNKSFSEIWLKRFSLDEDEEAEEEILFGYVLPLNAWKSIKEISSMFVEIDCMLFDEFQGDFNDKDVEHFADIHMSIARGGGRASRYVPVIMLSNSLTVDCPFFRAFGISSRIQSNTHFYRGEGLVLERFRNDSVADAQRKSGFNRALKNCAIMKTNIDNAWLNDDYSCVCKQDSSWGRSMYLATICDDKKKYGLRYFPAVDIWYLSRSVDEKNPNVWSLTLDNRDNVPLIKTGTLFVKLKKNYYQGSVRFSDLSLKNLMHRILI